MCPEDGCGRRMKMQKHSHTADGVCWCCQRQIKNKRHSHYFSIRHGTMFTNSNLTIAEILKICYFWSRNVSLDFLEHEFGISSATSVEWAAFFREIVEAYFVKNDSRKLGGPGKIVEIDESKFGKRKYNRGRCVDGNWVFGMIEREEKSNIMMVRVPDRSAETLVALIERWIEKGTTIMSDEWKAYSRLGERDYTHLTVNHSVNFVNPDTGACTNTIENSWLHAKKSFPLYGSCHENFVSHLGEFLWRWHIRHSKHDPFDGLLKALSQAFESKNWTTPA